MPKNILFAWVKNVYSLRKDDRTKGERTYTDSDQATNYPPQPGHKHPYLSSFIPAFPLLLSTKIITRLHLLKSHLYPLSTPLIITEKKIN